MDPGDHELLEVTMIDHQMTAFEISITVRDDETVEAVYIRFLGSEVARTAEIRPNLLLADYGRDGRLIGVELLGPVDVSVVAGLVEPERRQAVDRFLRARVPPEFQDAAA